MVTEVIKVDSSSGCAEAAQRGGAVLNRGGLVAFPTETVYGVAACVAAPGAVDRLRKVKQRPGAKAFTIHLGDREEVAGFVPEMSGIARRFVRKGWPGALTLIITVDDPSSAAVVAELDAPAVAAMYYDNTIGLRCPDDPVAQALLGTASAPVVAASANVVGRAPPCTGEEVLRDLDGQIDLLIDAGRTRYAQPSTIVRLCGEAYEIVREGVLDAQSIARLAKLRLLFVCTGNTCRSPMVAGIASTLLAQRVGCEISELADRGIVISSAGTGGGFGGASAHAVTVMRRRGIDISNHVSAPLRAEEIRAADHIFAMTRSHRDTVCGMVPAVEDRVALLLDDEDVYDPLGGTEEEYEQCARMVEEGVRARLQEVII